MLRIVLFLATNIAIMVMLGLTASILGLNSYLTANGLDLTTLLGFAAVMGFGGSVISLLISKPMAKFSTGARTIRPSDGQREAWLCGIVQRHAEKAGIAMPEVAVFEGQPNAFATGAFRNSALVAFSTGLLETVTAEEVDAVAAHEVAHIANGDMVTVTTPGPEGPGFCRRSPHPRRFRTFVTGVRQAVA
jgi:heat shock protein HtpX